MEEKKLKGQTASIVEFIFGGLLAIGGAGNLAFNPLNGLACIAFGAFLVMTGIQWRMLIKEYRTYMTVLSSDPTGSLTTIAQATNASIGTVKDNLKLMVKKGLAKGIVVDEQGNRVILRQQPADFCCCASFGFARIRGNGSCHLQRMRCEKRNSKRGYRPVRPLWRNDRGLTATQRRRVQ